MNIFENAKFGDIYVTKDEHKNSFCAFTKSNGEPIARLYREGWGVVYFYLDGRVHSGIEFGSGIDFDIIGKLEEPINEEELDNLAWSEYPDYSVSNMYGDVYGKELHIKERNAFKAGYRKAKEVSPN